MKKIFFLLLMSATIISCSDDNNAIPVTDDVSSTVQQKYQKLFEDYDNFKYDGQTITDESQIIKIIENSVFTEYNPSKREANFYSSDKMLKKLMNVDIQEIRYNVVSEKGLIDSRGKVYYEDEETFISDDEVMDGKSSLEGIAGLGTVAGNSTYTDFAKNFYIVSEYFNTNNSHYFSKVVNNSNMWNYNAQSVRARASGVTTTNFSLGRALDRLYRKGNQEVFGQGKIAMKMKNDTDQNDMKVVFYEQTSYNGDVVIISLDKDETYEFDQYQFDYFTNSYPLSMKILTDSEYYSGDW